MRFPSKLDQVRETKLLVLPALDPSSPASSLFLRSPNHVMGIDSKTDYFLQLGLNVIAEVRIFH
jgi:hypothetical protein